MKSENEIFRAIERMCEGLIYISETDAPILPFAGEQVEEVTAETVRHNCAVRDDAAVEEKDFQEFFARLTTIRDWYGDKEIARAKKFLELKSVLEEDLRELKVFRSGSIQIDIFVVGIGPDGNLMGVTTKAVET